MANKPGLAEESTKETVTPSRREGRIASAEPVCSCAFFSLLLHTRPRVQRAPGLPCALLSWGGMNLQNSGALCRENAKLYPPVMPATGSRECAPDDRLRRASSIPSGQRWNRKLAAYWIPASEWVEQTSLREVHAMDCFADARNDGLGWMRCLKFKSEDRCERDLNYDDDNTLTPPNAVMRPPFSITIWVASCRNSAASWLT